MADLISGEEIRAIALQAQGLNGAAFGKGKAGALNAIHHLGYVQLDTLSVVARAHHHTLWSRVTNYQERFLNELMREKKIFEYWSHAAAFLPMEDFRFSLVRKNEFQKGKKHWFEKDKKVHRYVLAKIKAEGAMQSRDFETDKGSKNWFEWKPAKIALEQLFQDGSLMIKERKGFQKVYDLTERILPAGVDTSIPSTAEFAEHLIRTALRAHGLASLKDFTHLRAGMRAPVEKELKKLLRSGEIIPVEIPDAKEMYYSFHGAFDELQTMDAGNENKVRILNPFDNAIIRRDRVMDLFGYDFRVEFYLPEHKRKFGYYCLPVLWKNKFVARFDPKADRKEKIFHVKKFHLEKKMNKKEKTAFMEAFDVALEEFARFNTCDKIAR